MFPPVQTIYNPARILYLFYNMAAAFYNPPRQGPLAGNTHTRLSLHVPEKIQYIRVSILTFVYSSGILNLLKK